MNPCKMCGAAWSAEAFYASNKSRCKECVKAGVRANRAAKIDYYREYDRARGLLPARKELVRANAHKYADRPAKPHRDKAPEKYKARTAVGNALRDGKLKRWPCARCGTTEGVQAHHDDYSRPFDVMWLCPTHHGERHRELNEMRRQKERAA